MTVFFSASLVIRFDDLVPWCLWSWQTLVGRLSAQKKCPMFWLYLFLWLSLGIVAISPLEKSMVMLTTIPLWQGISRRPWSLTGLCGIARWSFSGNPSLWPPLIGSFVGGAILSTFLIQYYGLRTIWFVSPCSDPLSDISGYSICSRDA